MEERYEYLTDQYNSKRITSKERKELEALIQKNPELAADFEFQQKLATAVVHHERRKLKETLQEQEAQIRQKQGSAHWTIWTKRIVSVAAVAFLGWFAWGYFAKQNAETAEIAFVKCVNEFASAGSDGRNPVLDQASNAYQAGDYAAAAQYFGQLDQTQIAHRFYLGVSLCGAGRYDDALRVLGPIAISKDVDYATLAQYYAVWSHYKKGNQSAACLTARAYLRNPEKKGTEQYRENVKKIARSCPE